MDTQIAKAKEAIIELWAHGEIDSATRDAELEYWTNAH